MKKLHENFYIPLFIISLIISHAIVGAKYGLYHSLPSYHLFKFPNDTYGYGGNALYHFFKWNLGFILFFLNLSIISIIFKVKIKLFELIAKEIKKKNNLYFLFSFTYFCFSSFIFIN